ncbi:zinc finger MYM-type protein 5-like [Protopterus annectens]|uniref:zinc finger MYM-type protein 5-like n=1 Tax=Protopterus annectens TaxID=7888 RepID=UPI001CFAE8F7|nr:zinc finger MYM-type protein 5-like [Protopterus annectens]
MALTLQVVMQSVTECGAQSVSGASIDSIPVWSELGAAHLSDQLDVCEEESKEVDPVTHREVYSDPGKWPDHMDDKVRCLLSAAGPVQIMNHSFPYDDHHRRFNPIFYNKRLTNGETVRRSWLVYSESSDLVFCFCCKLFSSTHLVALSSTGTCDWKNLGQKLIEHERSVKHKEAAAKWSDLHLRLKNSSTIDHHRENMIKSERKYWRNVLERLLAICQYLSQHNLAFRGSEDRLFTSGNGNFLGLVQLLGKFDPVIQEHLRRISNAEIHDHYLGKTIQNELIMLMSKSVRDTILQKITDAKYYSIILDCTPDCSHQEQMSLTVRIAECNESVEVKEYFLSFLQVTETTGGFLTDIVLN